ncbi:unnamed protein product [Heligmosomoides polygyrus]|uniref:Laminin EGF-like domain-containing protein n=1 Tax=Heligmosomoides polygyrus TaxID=6339 RepID=A0A183GBS1_HELPZ|nr:unnamed protein product [Heligmosomoides polygyrus]
MKLIKEKLSPFQSRIQSCSAYTIGTGVQATGCTTCTLPPATAPCSTCQTAAPAPPITPAPSAQWGEWGPFGQCTTTCGGGQRARQRLCNGGCTTCQCLGSSLDVQLCNTAPCPVACTTCQQTPYYDQPVTAAPCSTCGVRQPYPYYQQPAPTYQQPSPAYQQPSPTYQQPSPSPCLTCSTPYIQPAPSSCSTCGVNNRYYDPYGNAAGRRKRSEEKTAKGPLSTLLLT